MNPFFIIWYLWPLVNAGVIEGRPSDANPIIDVINGVLIDVWFPGSSVPELNISNRREITRVHSNAFKHVRDVESLILANNSLHQLPEFIFSNMTELKYLSLSGNSLVYLRNLFVGLENLQLLDISRTSIYDLSRGDLFGLTKSARILVGDGINYIFSITTDVFANPNDKKESSELTTTTSYYAEYWITYLRLVTKLPPVYQTCSNGCFQVRVCKSNGTVTSLEIHNEYEEMPRGCKQVWRSYSMNEIDLDYENITGFKRGWYRLRSQTITTLNLAGNKITEIEEILNDLPADLVEVNLKDNMIRKIGLIENVYLKDLNFAGNSIEEIEDGVFEKTKLFSLSLSRNKLSSLNFVSSLPTTLIILELSENNISSIPDGVFSSLIFLNWLELNGNKIETLQNRVFEHLILLQSLNLAANNITTIEPYAFENLWSLKFLDLQSNSIRDLRNNSLSYTSLPALVGLNLASNRITKIHTFANLSGSVKFLLLDENEIESLEEDSFVQVPYYSLSLCKNKISRIARGAIKLPFLQELHLDNNNLTTIGGDIYEGLSRLEHLSLKANKISEIRKGDCKNLARLNTLDLSLNSIEKLENGALYGLPTHTEVVLDENNLKEIHGGVFDDV